MSCTLKDRQQLIDDCQGLVHSLAWRIYGVLSQPVDIDDLIGDGQVGLARAARDFDPDRGVSFSTFAYYRIRGAIYDGLSKMSRFHRWHRIDTKYEQMSNEALLLQADGTEQADHSSCEASVSWLHDITGALAVVYLMSSQTGGDAEGKQEFFDEAAPAPPAVVADREITQKLYELVDALPAESAELIRSTYFDGLTLQEAGDRLGISKSWASRLHARALKQLARALRLLGVEE